MNSDRTWAGLNLYIMRISVDLHVAASWGMDSQGHPMLQHLTIYQHKTRDDSNATNQTQVSRGQPHIKNVCGVREV